MNKIAIDARTLQDSSRYRGIGRYTDHLLKNLQERKRFIIYTDNGFGLKPFKNIYDLPQINMGHAFLRVGHKKKLKEVLSREGVSLFHFTTQYNLYSNFRFPFTATIHDLLFFVFWQYSYRTWIDYKVHEYKLKRQFREAQGVITVSNSTKNDVIKYLRVPDDKIQVIHNGIQNEFTKKHNLKADKEILTQYQINKPYIFYLGSLDKRKNIVGMAKAFIKYNQQRKYQFVICHGSNPGPYYDLRRTIKGNEDQFLFLQYISHDHLLAMYRSASAFFFATLYEGFGYPILEAMSQGTPVITSNTSSMPEVGMDAAYYVDPYNEHSMTTMLSEVLDKKTDFDKHVQRGFEIVKEHSYQRFAQQTEEYLLKQADLASKRA